MADPVIREKYQLSLPSRERELKLVFVVASLGQGKSLPSRERELKPVNLVKKKKINDVAPFTGA